jgi:hypothetical protein
MMGVDILPTELPVESSTHFSNAISEVLEDYIQAKTEDGIDVKKLSPRLVSAHYVHLKFWGLILASVVLTFVFSKIVSRRTLILQRKKVTSRTTSSIWIRL